MHIVTFKVNMTERDYTKSHQMFTKKYFDFMVIFQMSNLDHLYVQKNILYFDYLSNPHQICKKRKTTRKQDSQNRNYIFKIFEYILHRDIYT